MPIGSHDRAMASKGMWRMIGRQVRSRRDRSIALGAGILVASVSFSLLTAAASTSQLEVHGTVENAPRPAYDILVRPKGAADAIETKDNLVRDNYLAGTFGGISIAQWQKILGHARRLVAAPIANIGYVILQATLTIPVGSLSSSRRNSSSGSTSRGRQRTACRHIRAAMTTSITPRVPLRLGPAWFGGYDIEQDVPGQAKPLAYVPVLPNPTGLNAGAGVSLFCFSAARRR